MDTSIKVPDSLALCARAGVQGMVKLNARELTGMMGVQEGVGIGDKRLYLQPGRLGCLHCSSAERFLPR